METQVKEKTEEEKQVNLQKIENYLKTASKHLFLTEEGKFFKAFPVQIKDKLYVVALEFDGVDSNRVWISDVNIYIQRYKNSAKSVLSDILFPQHKNKRTSIPNFKAMKEKTEEIKKFIEEKFDGTNTQAIQDEIKKMLVGLTVMKKEKGF